MHEQARRLAVFVLLREQQALELSETDLSRKCEVLEQAIPISSPTPPLPRNASFFQGGGWVEGTDQ